MKNVTFRVLTAVFAVTFLSCSPSGKEEPPVKPDQEKEEPAQPEAQEEVLKIEGTVIDGKNKCVGVVSDALTGKGIPGVTVSDGYSCVQTDENGVYQLAFNDYARTVAVSVPAAYKIPLDEKTHLPLFYRYVPVKKTELVRNDFALEPLEAPETKFTMVMIGDPQVKTAAQANRYKNETVQDIRQTLSEGKQEGRYPNAYAMTLGDIVFDTPGLWDNAKATMENVKAGDTWLPFFQCIGNHDHNATRSTSDYDAVTDYVQRFGPTDYSFDRGDVHIIVMDDIVGTSSNGSTWTYSAGFSDAQYEWLLQDLSFVKDKDRKMVFLCCHIPFRGGAKSGKGSSVNKDKHYEHVLGNLVGFHEAHLMIGHTHYAQNYIHTGYKCKGGQPVYEHIHQAACGAWWAARSSVSGAPNGYNIYEIDGASIVNWLNKGTGRDAAYQLRVYDGNQLYSGTKGYLYSWFAEENVGGEDGIVAIGNPALQGCFVAEVWDDDDQFVKVEFWKDGQKEGDFTRLDNGTCTNAALCAFWFNEKNKNTSTWASKTASHYWYYKPDTYAPSDMEGWEVKVFRTIPSSGKVNTWTRSELTTDYSEF